MSEILPSQFGSTRATQLGSERFRKLFRRFCATPSGTIPQLIPEMISGATEPLFIETPLVSSPILSKFAGCKILLKLENLQPSGSFKSRGLGNLCQRAIERLGPNRDPRFYCSSEGNAGLAAASAARILGKKATICVTRNTPIPILERLKAEGADVRQNGYYWSDADDLCRELVASDPDGLYCPPFDHQDVIDGNASLIYEIMEQMNGVIPDAVVCCVGGGGLQTVEQPGWKDVTVVGVETHGAASFYASHTSGKHVGIPEIDTIAKSLGAKKISKFTYDLSRRHSGHVSAMLVSDAQAANATWRFADDQRLMVEVACGATVSLVYEGLLKEAIPNLTSISTVVLVICGGSSVTIESLAMLKEKYSATRL